MPVIQVAPGTGGTGGGDATTGNQLIQINQLDENNGQPSVFKDVFNRSIFKTPTDKSVPVYANVCLGANTKCKSFENITPTLLATDIETFIQSVPIVIINITYADSGALVGNPFSALIIYNDY